jgi:hypothetical protein
VRSSASITTRAPSSRSEWTSTRKFCGSKAEAKRASASASGEWRAWAYTSDGVEASLGVVLSSRVLMSFGNGTCASNGFTSAPPRYAILEA